MSLKGVESSSDYNIANWGAGYFQYNRLGQIEIINPLDGSTVSLQSIIHYANQSGLSCPLLIRFSDILVDRVKKEILSTGYKRSKYALLIEILSWS